MAITQYRPATDLFGPLFEDFLRPLNGARATSLLRAPEADVIETESDIRVALEMPGMRVEDIDIGLENNVLTVSGEKRQEHTAADERNAWHLSERRYGRFSRSFALPRDVEAEQIQARFADGVLDITIPKSERARRRRIEIRGTDSQQRIETGAAK